MMDILKSLKDVTSLDEYLSVTQDVIKQSKNVKVQINITTVLTLKKIRSFEIEYLNKCDETGVACIILERLLALPPSKAWESGLGKELICLIQYWLEAIRKHLLNHSHRWWTFLRQLLIFIKGIQPKTPSIPNLLVEHLTECLLHIATSEVPDAFQRHEILHVLNVYCAESSRDIRFAMRSKFADYFVKLASQMATSGYLPHQYSTLECLVRWLVPRKERLLRAAAAEKWFPPDLYPNEAVQIFKQTSWNNFFQDARDFLNALNIANGLVTSVVLRRLSVGDKIIITGSEKQESWLDLNSVGPSVSVLLDPRALHSFGVRDFSAAFALCVTRDNAAAVQLHSGSGITLSITTDNPPSICPTDIKVNEGKTITVSLSSRNDLRKMDAVLNIVFGDKYELLLDLNSQISLSPPRSFRNRKPETNSEEDTRFSHPVEVKRKRHCGLQGRSRMPKGLNTPSSASGASIAQLYDKLATIPPHRFDKEWVSVCAQPALSHVSEVTEPKDDPSTNASTLQYKPYGVAQIKKQYKDSPKCRSDSETRQNYRETLKTQSDNEASRTRRFNRNLSPIVSDNEVTLLLATSIGSTDDTVIKETVERLSKKEGFDRRNIVDLLIQEALQEREKATDSGINTDDNKKSQDTEVNSEAIEGTPVLNNEKVQRKPKLDAQKKVCTIISKSTTDDESNTEVVNETPTFVTLRNRSNNNAKPKENSNTFDVNKVENFFSQHYTANREGDIVISPTLAKKINETSSESSNHFDDLWIMDHNLNPVEEIFEFNEIDIIECLNDVVDKVCHEFDKCSEYLREKTPDKICLVNLPITPKRATKSKIKSPVVAKSKAAKSASKSKPEIKIKFKTAPEKKNTKRVRAKEIKKTEKKMSTITEQTDDENAIVENEVKEVRSKVQTPKIIQKATNVAEDGSHSLRRKRKLYSPKDNEIQREKTAEIATSDADDNELLSHFKTKTTTPKSSVSCYKEIENERKKRIRSKPRISKGKVQEPPSPRTFKMNETFDKLKENVEGSEKIVLVDKTNQQNEVYNFTSESEDEDFKKKKKIVRKKASSTTVTSTNSKASNRLGRKKTEVNYSEWQSTDDEATKLSVKRKPPAKRATKQKAVTVRAYEHVFDLVDEKMRETIDKMDTSLIVEDKAQSKESPTIDLILNDLPEMEHMSDTEEPKKVKSVKTLPKKSVKKPEIKEKNKKIVLKVASDKEDNRSVASTSPLPGLVVENILSRKDDANDSITANMAQKFKKIYQDGPDQNVSNNTQNMLSDVERNNSQQNVGLSITDEIHAEYDNLLVEDSNKPIKTKVKSEFRKSHPAKEYNDDLIEIPEQGNKSCNIEKSTTTKLNQNRTKTGQIKENAEIMEISEDKIPHKSPMSIASNEINAYNDLEAAPPSPGTIKENVRPREIEDLDQSMREYYEKLIKEINISRDDSKEKSKSFDKSPVVAVKRLSIDDIGKYLPSPKSSTISSQRTPVLVVQRISLEDIDKYQSQRSSCSRTEKSPKGKLILDDIGKYLPSEKSNASLESGDSKAKSINTREKIKSPVINVGRISLEEFDKWLPPMPSPKKSTTPDPDYKPRSLKSKKNLKLIFKSNKGKTNRNSNSSEKSTRILRERISNFNEEIINEKPPYTILTRSFTRKLNSSKTTRTPVDLLNKREGNTARKSNIISPVRSFEEFVTNLQQIDSKDEGLARKREKTAKTNNKTIDLQTNNHSEDEITKTRTFAKRSDYKITVASQSSDISDDEIPKTATLAKQLTSKTKSRLISMKRSSSPHRVSEREVMKLKHKEVEVNEDVPSKKSKCDDVLTLSESGPSMPSVQDWFKRTETTTEGNITQPFEDIVNHILEKLNTTLVEIDYNTKKKCVNLFVGAQSQLDHMRDEEKKLFEELMNDLKKKSQEFKENLKQQVFELLKEDSKQKRAMFLILKEDVQSLLDFIQRNRSGNS